MFPKPTKKEKKGLLYSGKRLSPEEALKIVQATPLLKRTAMKRTPVSPLKRAKKKADTAFALYIRNRDNKCMLAGLDNVRCGGGLQCMHLRTRGVYILRFDEVNAMAGCAGHHVYYTNHPSDWDHLLQEFFPERWAYIEEHKNEEAHYKLSDYQELERFYTRLFEGIM